MTTPTFDPAPFPLKPLTPAQVDDVQHRPAPLPARASRQDMADLLGVPRKRIEAAHALVDIDPVATERGVKMFDRRGQVQTLEILVQKGEHGNGDDAAATGAAEHLPVLRAHFTVELAREGAERAVTMRAAQILNYHKHELEACVREELGMRLRHLLPAEYVEQLAREVSA